MNTGELNDPNPIQRTEWPIFFMKLAQLYAQQSTCPRAQVGCVIVAGKRQIGAGFNGAPSGMAHCGTDGDCVVEGHCGRSIHAEVNAVLQAMELSPRLIRNAVAYVTHRPCWHCLAVLRQAGITMVYYAEDYGGWDYRRDQMLADGNIMVRRLMV